MQYCIIKEELSPDGKINLKAHRLRSLRESSEEAKGSLAFRKSSQESKDHR